MKLKENYRESSKLVAFCLGIILVVWGNSAFAQSGETPIYKEQFAALVQSVDRVYGAALKEPSKAERLSLEEQVFALQKTAHRLQEQAGEAENQSRALGREPDRRLLLIEQGCMSIDLILAATNSFLSTGDRIFVGFATDVRPIVATILKSY